MTINFKRKNNPRSKPRTPKKQNHYSKYDDIEEILSSYDIEDEY